MNLTYLLLTSPVNPNLLARGQLPHVSLQSSSWLKNSDQHIPPCRCWSEFGAWNSDLHCCVAHLVAHSTKVGGWYSSTAQASASCQENVIQLQDTVQLHKRKGTWLWASLPYQKCYWTDFRFRAGLQRAIALHLSATAQQQQLCNACKLLVCWICSSDKIASLSNIASLLTSHCRDVSRPWVGQQHLRTLEKQLMCASSIACCLMCA